MAEKPSFLDFINLAATLALGGLGIYIALMVAESADRLSRENMLATATTYLLDDSTKRQQAGVNIVRDGFVGHWNEVPVWTKQMVARIASETEALQAPGAAPLSPTSGERDTRTALSQSSASQTPTAGAGGSSAQPIPNQLFAAVAGSLPRLFIQIADEAQRAPAEQLREAVRQEQLHGDPIVAGPAEELPTKVKDVELRFLKSNDKAEARQLAALLSRLIATPVHVNDQSQLYNQRRDVKARTYELWFPQGQSISVHASEAP